MIVRLPVDKYENQITSLHIFLDWKNFVDKSLKVLVNRNELHYVEGKHGVGTDGEEHEYTEYYVDEGKTLVDYSYMYDEDGNIKVDEDGKPMYDRWDYWSADDFI